MSNVSCYNGRSFHRVAPTDRKIGFIPAPLHSHLYMWALVTSLHPVCISTCLIIHKPQYAPPLLFPHAI